MTETLPPVPIRKIPMGMRSLPVAKPPTGRTNLIAAEACGRGSRIGRAPRLDELDRDNDR